MQFRVRLLVALGAAVALLAVVATRATVASPQPLTFAIADDAAQRAFPSELGSARSTGFGAARAYVGWADVARRRPARPRDPSDPAYDWRQTDADLARYRSAGLAVWIAFWRTPQWASGSADTAVWPTAAADLGDFAYAVARRYPQVRVFMDWNEPNLLQFAKPNTLAAYEPMARAIYAGVKAADPAAEVIAGNLARYRDNGRDPAAWAARLRADAVPMDAFGIHPYPDPLKPLAERSPRLRVDLFDVPALSRIAGVPVAVTEYGWSSQLAGIDDQAAWTAQAITVARCTPGLSQFVFWGYHDHPVPVGQTPDPWVTFGWLDANGVPKPVLAAGKGALASTPDCASIAGAPPGWPATSTLPPAETPPVCTPLALAGTAGAPIAAALPCSDADADPLTYRAVAAPAHGTLALADGSLSYTADAAFAGPDAFSVRASDGIASVVLPVTVDVAAAAPAPPVATALSPPVVEPPAVAAIAPPPAPVTVPHVRVTAPRVRGRAIALAVTCPAAAPCSSQLRVSVSGLRVLRSLRLAAGSRTTVRLALSRRLRRAASGRLLAVRVTLDGVARTTRLRIPRP